MNVGVRLGKCPCCATKGLDKNIPPTFGPTNNMRLELAPPSLSILNSTEQTAISLICPQLTNYKLKCSATGMKGHSISFYQVVQWFVDRVPHKSQPNQWVDLRLDYLKKHNQPGVQWGRSWLLFYSEQHTDQKGARVRKHEGCEGAGSRATNQWTNDLDDNTGVLEVVMIKCPLVRWQSRSEKEFLVNTAGLIICICLSGVGPHQSREGEYGFFSKLFPSLFPMGFRDLTKSKIRNSPKFVDDILTPNSLSMPSTFCTSYPSTEGIMYSHWETFLAEKYLTT